MTRKAGITAIVLAGGRSMRFGDQKLAVEIEGRTLLEHAISAVDAVADEVIIAGRTVPAATEARVAGRPFARVRSIADVEAYQGPLAGLAGALGATTTGLAIVVGGDMPAMVPQVLRALASRLAADSAIDAVLLAAPSGLAGAPPTDPPYRQVLPLAIDVPVGLAAALEVLAAGDRSLVRLLDRLRVEEIPAAEWLALDPTGRTLLDVDRPKDVARIRHELRRTPSGGAR
jgi:molybdopterin-guanine dinucleotide biosynthesis protein A